MNNGTKTDEQLLWEIRIADFFCAEILPKIADTTARESRRLRNDIDSFRASLHDFIKRQIDELVLFAGTAGFHRLPRDLQTYCFMNMAYEMNQALPDDYPIRFVRILIKLNTKKWILGTIDTPTPKKRDLHRGKFFVHTHIFQNTPDFEKRKRSEMTVSRVTLAYPPRDYVIP